MECEKKLQELAVTSSTTITLQAEKIQELQQDLKKLIQISRSTVIPYHEKVEYNQLLNKYKEL